MCHVSSSREAGRGSLTPECLTIMVVWLGEARTGILFAGSIVQAVSGCVPRFSIGPLSASSSIAMKLHCQLTAVERLGQRSCVSALVSSTTGSMRLRRSPFRLHRHNSALVIRVSSQCWISSELTRISHMFICTLLMQHICLVVVCVF